MSVSRKKISKFCIRLEKRNNHSLCQFCEDIITCCVRFFEQEFQQKPIVEAPRYTSPANSRCSKRNAVWIPMNSFEFLWIPVNSCEFRRIPINSYEILWIPEVPWLPVKSLDIWLFGAFLRNLTAGSIHTFRFWWFYSVRECAYMLSLPLSFWVYVWCGCVDVCGYTYVLSELADWWVFLLCWAMYLSTWESCTYRYGVTLF